MDNKIFYLSTCSTCKRILGELDLDDTIILQDIKKKHISAEELDEIHELHAGTYEDLLNKRSRVYQAEKLKEQNLSEEETRNWILKEYSMLKRPLAVIDGNTYVGNAAKTVEALKEAINK